MAIKRKGAALRLGDQVSDWSSLCVGRCAAWEHHGAGTAVVIERCTRCDRTQLKGKLSTDAEIADVIQK